MNTFTPDLLVPEWSRALQLYKTTLEMSLRGIEPPLTAPYEELQAQLRSLLKTDMVTCGLWGQFETWAKRQLGWQESTVPNVAGLVPPGFAEHCAEQYDLWTQLEAADVSALSTMQALSAGRARYVTALADALATRNV